MQPPDFLGIGAQKAGTTWLYRMLGQHPGIWLPPLKELHYFSALYLGYVRDPETGLCTLDILRMQKSLKSVEWLVGSEQSEWEKIRRIYAQALIGLRTMSDEWYLSVFGLAPPGPVLKGEITPEYALLPDHGVEHIARVNPQIKIVFLLRDPIERGWSDLRMERHQLQLQEQPPDRDYLEDTRFIERADYATTIERYRKFLPHENILVIYYDELATQPMVLLERVCRFLGAEFDPAMFRDTGSVIHAGPRREMPPEIYRKMRDVLRPGFDRLLALEEPTMQLWHKKHYG